MALDGDDVRTIARLARLGLDEPARARLANDLEAVLSLVAELRSVDTDGVEPMAHPLDATLALREDEVTETDRREALQRPAPEVEDGYFLVPRVIE